MDFLPRTSRTIPAKRLKPGDSGLGIRELKLLGSPATYGAATVFLDDGLNLPVIRTVPGAFYVGQLTALQQLLEGRGIGKHLTGILQSGSGQGYYLYIKRESGILSEVASIARDELDAVASKLDGQSADARTERSVTRFGAGLSRDALGHSGGGSDHEKPSPRSPGAPPRR